MLIIIVLLLLLCVERKEKFGSKLLNRCFDESVYNEFNEYSKKIKVDGGIVYVTPTIHVPNIPMISWNGLFLNNLCVEPDIRNTGVGTQLVSGAIEYGRERGYDHIILQVKSVNYPAIRIYEKLGFVRYMEGRDKNHEYVRVYVYYI